jgi:hypothetical protein
MAEAGQLPGRLVGDSAVAYQKALERLPRDLKAGVSPATDG